VENCSKGNALDKHVVLFVNEKYYVSCAEHVRQLGGESPLHNLMEVKC
jgi:hypothetical protein